MKRQIVIFFLLLGVILVPFLLQEDKELLNANPCSDDRLVIITPHNESVRYEFDHGFRQWYQEQTGRSVYIDWRVLGGSQEIIQYLHTLFLSAFQYHWEHKLKYPWKDKITDWFKSPSSDLEGDALAARNAFLDSNVGCGIDIIFGGGELEVGELADNGYLVDSGIFDIRKDLFDESIIPSKLGGLDLWDPKRRWIGTSHSGFGIIYNKDVLKDKGIQKKPDIWKDLSEDEYFGEIALADPSISASSNRAFEMIIQEQMNRFIRSDQYTEGDALARGWMEGLKLIQLIASNARYFTDWSTKPVLDVSAGDCAAGMAIDFFGMYQVENLKKRSDSDRFGFIMPKEGSVPTADVVGLFRGAPNKEVAVKFIEYSLSLEGQKLWAYKVGTPDGPVRYALRRPPVRKDLYAEEHRPFLTTPDYNAYEDIGQFRYHPEWTGPVFRVLRFIIKAAFVDAHEELAQARKALIAAKRDGRVDRVEKAMDELQFFEGLDYENASNAMLSTILGGDPLKVIRLQNSLTERFRNQYRKVQEILDTPS